MSRGVLEFPPFRLDLDDERLWRDDVAVRLRPRTFAVLRILVERPGRLVTKDDFWSAVWKGAAVTDDTLTKSIRELRSALGDDPSAPRFIETVHGRGFRWLAARAAPPSDGARPGATADNVVGRAAELGALDERLADALRGRRQLVLVGGEAGIGKTTLIDAFFGRLAGDERLWLARGQAVESYGAGEAYLPVLEALERLCRTSAGGELAAVLRRHAPMWLAQMPSLVDAAERTALQRETAGLTQHRMVRELAQALEVATASRGLVLCLDDLQWSDTSTLALLDFLARRREPARLLLIGLFRPADVLGGERPLATVKHELRLHDLCTEMSVSRLDEDAVEEYALRRLGDGVRPISRDLATALHRRTEGNPLFMAQVLHDLVEREVLVERDGRWEMGRGSDATPAAPLGIRQFIEQQLDRLSAREQEVLEAAAVAGLEFSAAAAAAGLEASDAEVEEVCASLARREQFLQDAGSEEWPDGTIASRFRFLHALHHEALCARATSARRVLLHRRIGARKERGHAEHAADIAPQLARHFDEGRDPRRAVHYLARAADVAARRRAPLEAVTHLSRALELLQSLAEDAERDREELSLRIDLGVPLLATRGYAAPEVERTYARARELCRRFGTTRDLFPVLHGLWLFYEVRGELGTARELAGELLALAEKDGDSAFLLQAHHVMGETRYLQGELVAARAHLERAVALHDPSRHHGLARLYGLDPGVVSRCYLAWALGALGELDRADERSREAMALAHEAALPLGRAVALVAAASVAHGRGEVGAVREHAQQAIALSDREGLPLVRARGAILHGWALAETGEAEAGIAQIRDGLAAYDATGARAGLQFFLALLADALGKSGHAADGLDVVRDALARTAVTGEHHHEEELHRLRGELLLLRSEAQDRAEGEACLQTALDGARARGAGAFELRAATALAALWQRYGRTADARELLARSYGAFSEGFATADVRRARTLLEQLDAA